MIMPSTYAGFRRRAACIHFQTLLRYRMQERMDFEAVWTIRAMIQGICNISNYLTAIIIADAM